MPHGHGGAGENPEEIHAFANSLLRGGKSPAKITSQTLEKLDLAKPNTGHRIDGDRLLARFDSPTSIVKAELSFTKDSGDWGQREWLAEPAQVDTSASEVASTLPSGARVCYLNLTDERGLVVSSEHVELADRV